MSWNFRWLLVCLDDIISEIYVKWLLFLDVINEFQQLSSLYFFVFKWYLKKLSFVKV